MSEIPADLITALQNAQHVVALTGAGISAESGVPTFRDAQTGLWACYQPEDLATPEAFARHPRLVWEWYAWRRELVTKAVPNPGHLALAALEARISDFCLITQNVDGLHRRAGSRNVIEIHGNIHRIKCAAAGHITDSWSEEGALPPRCPRCGAMLRPDVVWFGEILPEQPLREAHTAIARCQVFLCIGTSGLVQPAASLPLEALRHGAILVEVNPHRTPLTPHASFVFAGPAGEILPALYQAAWPPA
jgi:NAD-dependent deacetylase